MAEIRDENYYQICGWMINKLNLKGTPLCVYAIIYGFSQDGESEFAGSRKYLSEFLNVSKPTIDKALQELTDQGFIIKTTKVINNITFNSYKADLQVVKKLYWGGKETLLGGGKETLHNNNNLNNNNYNNDNKERKKERANYDEIIFASTDNFDLKETLYEFIKMRTLIKKPMTDRALEMLINKLKRLSAGNDDIAIKILNQSIINNWQDVYELKQPATVEVKTPVKQEEKPEAIDEGIDEALELEKLKQARKEKKKNLD